MTLGWHWLCEVRTPERLDDPARMAAVLVALAEGLALTVMEPPVARETAMGVAAVILLGESHASIHTDVARGVALVDLFSCVPFEASRARAIVHGALGGTLRDRVIPREGM